MSTRVNIRLIARAPLDLTLQWMHVIRVFIPKTIIEVTTYRQQKT